MITLIISYVDAFKRGDIYSCELCVRLMVAMSKLL